MSAEAKTHRRKKAGAAKPKNNTKQLGIVAVLLLVLLVALLTSPEAAEESAPPPADLQLTASALAPVPVEVIAEPHPAFTIVETIPPVAPDEWAGNDPFAPIEVVSDEPSEPLAASEPSVAASDAVPEPPRVELPPVEVQAVYGRGDDAVALIGGAVVHVGERLPDGRQVVSVSDEGVELSH